MGIIHKIETLMREHEFSQYLIRVESIAESENEKKQMINAVNSLRDIQDRYSLALENLSFKTILHPVFMDHEEYSALYEIEQDYRVLKFTEKPSFDKIFPDNQKFEEIESWMDKNKPDYNPLSDFFDQ
ncbi:MAG: hypothetical protein KAI26_03465 [Nanoarchaeota archaeon]|nr:hypothetical protein [Nanoarchaeota archaeon]